MGDGQRTGMVALAAGSVLDATAEELIEVAAAAGFDAVGVRPPPDLLADAAALRALARRARDAGIAVHDVEVHRIGGEPDHAERLVEAAAMLGARYVLVVSDLRDVAATQAALAGVVGHARSADVGIGLEYMAWTTPSDPVAAVRLARSTGALVVVDVLHHVRVGAGPAELAGVVASGRLGWVQLCDAPLAPPADLVHEARHARLLPGAGELPLDALVATIPVGTTISVEVQSDALAAALAPRDRARALLDAANAALTRRG